MSSNWGPPAHNFVPEYQQSSIPFVTSSATNEVTATPVRITFPYVTRWIQVFNTDSTPGDTIRVGFSQSGVSPNAAQNANYLILSGGVSTQRLELKCKELWFRQHGSNPTSFSLIAGLTNVPSGSFPVLTGSLGIDGVG